MYKIISSLLLIAFFAGTSAFATSGKPATTVSKQDAPEAILSVNLSQTGAGEATGTWTSSGPTTTFRVSLLDLTTNTRVEYMITGNSFVFTGLTIKHTYRLSVWDGNFLSDDEFIAF